MISNLSRFLKYCVIAGGAALVDWVLFVVLFAVGVAPVNAQMVARVAGGAFSFSLNRRWNFRVRGPGALRDAMCFVGVILASYVAAVAIFFVSHRWLGVGPYFSKLTADSACFLLNFVLARYWVFRVREDGPVATMTFATVSATSISSPDKN